ncbi:MAG TPA: patatin-like phospholipase family protein [Rhizomicrobium sp.]|nr:patatin-like phospholipase family protein [Rhizomicrobium sp.]
MAQYRILSLDGGGSWALIQVKALIDLYSHAGDGTDITGHQILKKFDLIVGNSGGTLTLGGLLLDMTLSDLLGFFLDEGKRKSIFAKASFCADPAAHILRVLRAGLGAKYSARAKLKGLKTMLGATGERNLSTMPALVGGNYAGRNPDFVFCGFDYDMNRETFFRSNLDSLAASRSAAPMDTTVALAIHASTNAPLNYFDAPAQGLNHARYWDGAMGGYNNPVLAGTIEALANGADRSQILALSIGTASVALPLQTHRPNEDPNLVAAPQNSNIVNDLKRVAGSILDDPPDAASFHAHVMLGCPLPALGSKTPITSGRIFRLNPLVQPLPGDNTAPWKLPAGISDDDFSKLVNLQMDAVEQDQVLLIAKFCDAWLADGVRNQGIRVVRETLLPDIGFATYSQAKAAWLAACAGPHFPGANAIA